MPVQCIAGLVTLGITAPEILAIVSPASLVIKLLPAFCILVRHAATVV